MTEFDYDVLVIGSGFGGSVTALRLMEKGYRVAVLEAGRRFADDEFAKTNWRVRKYLWAPAFGCFGIQRMTLLRNSFIMSGAGVGGGSLVYANTLYPAPDTFFSDSRWSHITDWKAELAPYYDQASRMLGVTTNPVLTPTDTKLREVADEMGFGHTFVPTPVGVLFAGPKDAPGDAVPDPFFGGTGPERRNCTLCGGCLSGCRYNAKNTLVKNYLYLAEQAGAHVFPLTTVTAVRQLDTGGYAVDTARTGRWVRKARQTLTAEQVVFSAASLGTQRLLHRMRDEGHLPNLSSRLGTLSRTNSEAVVAARTSVTTTDYSTGVALTSSVHPDPVTHIEAVRYGKGSNLVAMMMTVLTDGDAGNGRWRTAIREFVKQRRDLATIHSPRHWSERTIGLVAMQTLDNSITTYTKRNWLGRKTMTTKQGEGEPNPNWIPAANEVARRLADKIDGVSTGFWTDLANIPVTAHFIGGCAIGDSIETGVVDPYQRLYGYPGLHVVDGSTITANLGVNPSLTITAQAERAMAFWPNKNEDDPRPPLGTKYVRIQPVPPKNPVVPDDAPAALRLPIVSVSPTRSNSPIT